MTRLLLLNLALIVSTLNSCANNNSKSVKSDSETKSEVQSGTIKISKSYFINNIMNYEDNHEEWKFEGDKPCIVDFYADWCAPCRITSPIMEELALEYNGLINIYKVDVQKEQELSSVFGIQSIPAFLFCPMKGQPRMSSGIAQTPAETKQMFKQTIDDFLLKK